MNNNQQNRQFFDADEITTQARAHAARMIESATRPNGSLNWSKLPKLLTVNPKVIKGEKLGYMTAILHLSPSFMSGYNVCPFATGCGKVCLTFAGHGQKHMLNAGKHAVHIARIARTILFHTHRDVFLARLHREIGLHVKRARKADASPVVRLNGTSDIDWQRFDIIPTWQNVQFYDYTKVPGRFSHYVNYHLTFSRSESNAADVADAIAMGQNVAVVFRRNARKMETLPTNWHGRAVVDGDVTDLRFLDNVGVIVGLRSKASAFGDASGFVVD